MGIFSCSGIHTAAFCFVDIMTEFFEDLLTCKLCLGIFKDPVTLSCDHSFCFSCLQKNWEQNKSENCPFCRKKSTKDNLVVNSTLREMADSFSQKTKAQ